LSCSVTDPLGCLSSAANSVGSDVLNVIAHDFGQAADSTINWLWGQLSNATAVQLGGQGFDLDIAIVATITGVVAVGLFVIQLAASVLRRDPGGLARAVRGLFVAFLAGAAAVGVTNLALSSVDSLSAGVVQVAMGSTINQMGQELLDGAAILDVGNPAGVILLSIVAIVASVIVWAALVVRKALIVVSAVFAPLAFAGSLADITVGWTRKWVEIMTALIVSKLLLVIIFIVGWGILDNGVGQAGNGTTQAITQTATGLLILTLAGFAPWMALKLVHFGDDQFHRLHVLAGTTTGGARAAAAAPQKVAAWKATAASLGMSGAAGAAGASNGAAVTAQRPPGQGNVGQANGRKSPTPSGAPGSGTVTNVSPSASGTTPAPPAGASERSAEPSATRAVQQLRANGQ
jgi:type IV secretion system protein TrbL